MLYKNDVPYKLTNGDLKVLNDKFKRFPLAIIYPPERITKNRSPQNNGKPDKPNSISFPLTATVKTTTGAEQWRYAENVIIKDHGVKKYTPKNLRFNGRLPLQETDAELAWFLFTKSEYCKGGLNHRGKTYKFMFEDLISDAERQADLEAVRSQVKSLIYGKEMGLSEERLRMVAKAYFIKNVDMLALGQVKVAIEHQVNRDPTNGMKKFIEMTKGDEILKLRVRMQDLIDAQRLKFDTAKKEWAWIDGDKKLESICKVAPGVSPNDVLCEYYLGNRDFQEVVEVVEKSRKVKTT